MRAYVSDLASRAIIHYSAIAIQVTLGSVSIGLALVAMLACYIPARRVLRIEAAQSLRLE